MNPQQAQQMGAAVQELEQHLQAAQQGNPMARQTLAQAAQHPIARHLLQIALQRSQQRQGRQGAAQGPAQGGLPLSAPSGARPQQGLPLGRGASLPKPHPNAINLVKHALLELGGGNGNGAAPQPAPQGRPGTLAAPQQTQGMPGGGMGAPGGGGVNPQIAATLLQRVAQAQQAPQAPSPQRPMPALPMPQQGALPPARLAALRSVSPARSPVSPGRSQAVKRYPGNRSAS